jgi:hypothetical protein
MNRVCTSLLRTLLAATAIPVVCSVTRDARAETTVYVGGAGAQRDFVPAGNDAPYSLFGTKGTRALGFALDIGAANSGLSSRPLGMGGQIALDSFVVQGLSVGGEFGFDVATVDGGFYEVGGGPRVGYALRLGDKLALWPMVTMDYQAGTVPSGTGTVSLQNLRVGGSLPLVLTLGGQVAFELGPVASTDVWRSVAGQDAARMDLVGLRTGLVGWF